MGSVSGNTQAHGHRAHPHLDRGDAGQPLDHQGATEQFTATGTYSDASTANITSQVTWASGTTTAATITSGGLASGVGVGSSTITATLGSVSGNTKLTVTAPTTGAVSLLFKGSLNYLNSGALTSGGFKVTKSNGIITSVTGIGTIAGLHGGSATIGLLVARVPTVFKGQHVYYVGAITVQDPSAKLNATSFVYDVTLTQNSSGGVSGVAYGLSPNNVNGKILYTLSWTV